MGGGKFLVGIVRGNVPRGGGGGGGESDPTLRYYRFYFVVCSLYLYP